MEAQILATPAQCAHTVMAARMDALADKMRGCLRVNNCREDLLAAYLSLRSIDPDIAGVILQAAVTITYHK